MIRSSAHGLPDIRPARGTIAIESPPEGGTTVTIWLPRSAQQAAA